MTRPCHHANGQAVEWLPLWQLDDPAVPLMPTPEQVRRRKREERELRLLERHGEALLPALMRLLADPISDMISRQLAAEAPALLAELGEE